MTMNISSSQAASDFAFSKTRKLKPSPVNLCYLSTKLEKTNYFGISFVFYSRERDLGSFTVNGNCIFHELGENFPLFCTWWTSSTKKGYNKL